MATAGQVNDVPERLHRDRDSDYVRYRGLTEQNRSVPVTTANVTLRYLPHDWLRDQAEAGQTSTVVVNLTLKTANRPR
jgi:hypothetical protein